MFCAPVAMYCFDRDRLVVGCPDEWGKVNVQEEEQKEEEGEGEGEGAKEKRKKCVNAIYYIM